jgi:hypothetical protein
MKHPQGFPLGDQGHAQVAAGDCFGHVAAAQGRLGVIYPVEPAAPHRPAFIRRKDRNHMRGLAPTGHGLKKVPGIIEHVQGPRIVREQLGQEMPDGLISFFRSLTGLQHIAHFIGQGHGAVTLLHLGHQGMQLVIGSLDGLLPLPSLGDVLIDPQNPKDLTVRHLQRDFAGTQPDLGAGGGGLRLGNI